jgi:hypothetical protein
LLFKFILPWLVNLHMNPDKYYFSSKNSIRRIYGHFKRDILALFVFIAYFYLILLIKRTKRSLTVNRTK